MTESMGGKQPPHKQQPQDDVRERPYLRAQNEDDDGYDPYSDRPPMQEPLFEEDPWS